MGFLVFMVRDYWEQLKCSFAFICLYFVGPAWLLQISDLLWLLILHFLCIHLSVHQTSLPTSLLAILHPSMAYNSSGVLLHITTDNLSTHGQIFYIVRCNHHLEQVLFFIQILHNQIITLFLTLHSLLYVHHTCLH